MAKKDPKAAGHGVDKEHTQKAPVAEVRNDATEKGDHKKDEQGVDTGEREANTGEQKSTKSIVPNKYAGKYKGGGSDPLAKFLTEHSAHPESKEFDFERFFTIMDQNGIAEAHIKPFEDAIAAKAPGAQGRARMTLRNRLDAIVRKNGKIKDHDGNEHDMKLEPRAPRPQKVEAEKEPAAA